MEANTKKKAQSDELTPEEVNVYSNGCGLTKLHCMVDCEVTHNSLLSPDH